MSTNRMWLKRAAMLSAMAICGQMQIAFAAQEAQLDISTAEDVAALATETRSETVDGTTWTYMVVDGKAVLGGGRRSVRAVDAGTSGDLVVPSSLGGYPVVAVGNYAFYDCDKLTSVTIPVGVVSIGKDAFNGATSLASIVLPDGLTTLGSGAFEECWSLASVMLPDTLSELPECVFSYCEALQTLTVPASVRSFGEDVFYGCDALESVTFLGAPPEMDGSWIFDLDIPPTLICRTAWYSAFRDLAVEGQRVLTFDGAGLVPITESLSFGTVGMDTTDYADVTFENTSTGSVIVTGIGYTGFSSAPVETFDDASAIDGWTFVPAKAWGVQRGVLSSCTNDVNIDGMRYCYLPQEYDNFTVQADIRLYGDQNYAVGVFARADDSFDGEKGSGWRFQIAPSGSYMILRCIAGSMTIIVGWTDSDAINKDGVNTLAVAVRGSLYAFSINGELVWSGEDDSLPASGSVGFFNYDANIGNYMTVDNLRIMSDVFADGHEDLNNASFAFATNFPFTVPMGGSVTLPLAFRPQKTGALGAIVGLVTPSGASAGVRATGTGAEDDFSFLGIASLSFAGHTGGPFSPDSIEVTVSNSFRLAQSFTVSKPDWLDCSHASVTLGAGAATNLTFSPNASASALATGVHDGEVELLHTDNGHVVRLPYSLNSYVTGTPVLPEEELVVTNRPGQVQTRTVDLVNASSSDGNLAAKLTTFETGSEVPMSQSLAAIKAARRAAGPRSIAAKAEYNPQRILVRFDPANVPTSVNRRSASSSPDYAAAVSRLCGGRVVKVYRLVPGLVLVELAEKAANAAAMEAKLRTLEADAAVVYAEPDYLVKANLVPNDPQYSNLWGMKNTGQLGGTPGADISAEEAWDMTTGSSDIIVGVIDTGIDYSHPDLAANMWTNPGEIPDNGIDDDGNGYVDDVYGINAINMDGDPMDDHYHGTHCAGTIGAVGDNGEGVAGVCWNVRIMALKFLDSFGFGGDADAITCIEYATENGAKVLSNSWGGYGGVNQAMIDAIEAAGAAGVTFVAAAGNETNDNDGGNPHYPSSYDCDSIIAVVSTDRNDGLSDFSNYGATTCDIGAPGSSILSCAPGGGYQYLSGTSMATPHVAGAAALLLSRNPVLTPAQVKETLLSTGDPIPALDGKCVSGARMNVAAALKSIVLWSSVSPESVVGIPPGGFENIAVSFDAGSLAIGEYTGILRAVAQDEEQAVAAMPIRMVVIGDDLSLDVSDGLAVTRREGETPSGEALELFFSNTGPQSVAWTLSSSADWLSVAQTSGTLAAGNTASVALSVVGGEALPAGRYTATVTLENVATGARFFATVVLAVTPGTGPLYVDPVNGDDANHGRLPAYPMRTLQGAVGRATDGTEILLPAGVYGPVAYVGSASFAIRGVDGCEKTFIDGGGTNRCCTFLDDSGYSYYYGPNGTNVAVIGVTLMNGFASGNGTRGNGGAAYGGMYDACRLINSCALQYGGGACNALLNRCEVSGNAASGQYGGGLYYCSAFDSLVAGNIIESQNYSYGAGAYYGYLTGCTVAGNRIESGNGWAPGVYYAAMTNTIVWANSMSGNANVTQAGYNSSSVSVVLTQDPSFRAPGDGVWTLRSGSQALDAGDDSAVVNVADLAGNDRVQGDSVDIGCYEGVDERPYVAVAIRGVGALSAPYVYADAEGNASLSAIETTRSFLRWEDENGETVGTDPTLSLYGVTDVRHVVAVFEQKTFYVDAAKGDDSNSGTDAAFPLKTISAAVANAESGDTVHVAAGVYGPIDTGRKALTILGAGFGESIIDGGGTSRCATLGNSTNGTVLVGFTLRNGYAVWNGNRGSDCGGGACYGCLVACELTGNYAENYGGGAYYSRLESCLVACNTAKYSGGGTYYGATYNCSVVGNTSDWYERPGSAGGYHCNSAFAGNTFHGEELEYQWDTYRNCRFCSWNCGMVDPFHGDARLRTWSRLIDAGSDAYVTCETDLAGADRIQGECVDIGCYEGVGYEGLVALAHVVGHGAVEPETVLFEPGGSVSFTAVEDGRRFMYFLVDGEEVYEKTITLTDLFDDIEILVVFESAEIYADAFASTDGDGMSPSSPVRSLQDAIDLAYDGEAVFAAPGVYDPIDASGKRIDIRATGGRDATIIDGGGEERCATLGYSQSFCSTLSGFTLRNGFHPYEGGGAYFGVLSNCVLTANSVEGDGSYCYGGATYYATLYDCDVFGNVAAGYEAYGGGAYGGNAYRTTFSNNVARAEYYAYGGATRDTSTYSCLFVGNEVYGGESGGYGMGYGGATYYGDHYNATIVNNVANGLNGGYGGGSYYGSLYNSIVYGNSQTSGDDMYGCDEYNVMTEDPLFVDLASGDFRLTVGSPAIDAGDNDYVYTQTDLVGNPRIQGSAVDLGCYEGGVITSPPERVTGLVAARGTLKWNVAYQAEGYNIYRATQNDVSAATLIGTSALNAYTDDTAVEGTTYYYWVVAFNVIGSGTISDSVENTWPDPLSVATTELPSGRVHDAYELQLDATGGVQPYTWEAVMPGYAVSSRVSTFEATGTAQGWHVDNGCWMFTLPFDFPFYGNSYRTAYVSSNGTIAFGDFFSNTSYGDYEFLNNPMIAVLWKDLVTTDNYDIFVESGEESVKIRWAARYYGGELAANASATLFADGRIVLSYGSGNANGGFCGISAGDGERYVIGRDVGGSWGNADDIVFAEGGYSASESGLPEGLSLSEDGILSGVAAESGLFSVYVRVTDAVGQSVVAELPLEIEKNPVTLHVDAENGDDANDGLTWEAAMATIQAAIDAAFEDDTILVADGTYGPIYSANRRIRIESVNGASTTFIDGGGVDRCATLSDRYYNSAYDATNTVLVGFTLCNGAQDGSYYVYGGGVFFGMLDRCVISNCVAIAKEGNSGWNGAHGGGVYYGVLNNCLVVDNWAESPYCSYGGGTFYSILRNCTVIGNYAFGGETAQGIGMGYGGGSYGGYAYNTIIWGNGSDGSYSNAYYVSLYNSWTQDPLFDDDSDVAFLLSVDSPCVDAGDNAYVVGEVDLAGNPRIVGAAVDIGCYEGVVYDALPGLVEDVSALRGVVTWTADIMAQEYEILRSETDDISGAVIVATVYGTEWTDDDADVEHVYWYWVRAKNPLGVGEIGIAVQMSWPAPVSIATHTLPDAMEMVSYSAELEAIGGVPPYSWSCPDRGYTVTTNSTSTFAEIGTAQGWTSDDSSWEYNLPFAFLFYGRYYSSVYVNDNGALSFGRGVSNYYYAQNVFANTPMIAGLWTDLIANPGDIYIESSADSVTFRWARRHWGNRSLEYNFSVTLCENGHIIMAYGDGNSNGGFVGASAGDGEHFLVIYDSYESLDNADSIELKPSGLPVGISLSADGKLSGVPALAGTNTFTVVVSDAAGDTDERELSIFVAENPNHKPVIDSATPATNVYVKVGNSVTFAVTAHDPEGEPLEYIWYLDGDEIECTTASFTFAPVLDDAGAHTLECVVSDGLWADMVRQRWSFRVVRDWFVDAAAEDDPGDGSSAVSALGYISEAVGQAEDGDTIYVAPGFYEDYFGFDSGNSVSIIATGGASYTFFVGQSNGMEWWPGADVEQSSMTGFTMQGCNLDGVTLKNCVLTSDVTGAYPSQAHGCRLFDCAVTGNTCDYSPIEQSELTGCTVAGNTVGEYGAVSYDSCVYDSIVWDNVTFNGETSNFNMDSWWGYDENDNEVEYASVQFEHSCTWPMPLHGADTRVITTDPRLVDAVNGDLRLRVGSPCIVGGVQTMGVNLGDAVNGRVISVRIEGHGAVSPMTAILSDGEAATFEVTDFTRPFLGFSTNGVFATANETLTWPNVRADGIVIAAFSNFTFHVDAATGDDANDGLSWATAKASIQSAINNAVRGETIYVKAGTYDPIVVGAAMRLRIESVDGKYLTIIDGGGTNQCANLGGNDSFSSTLVGFTLTNGYSSYGGGAYGGTLVDCDIVGNEAIMEGGGLYYSRAMRCRISDNSVYDADGSYSARGGGACGGTLINCLVVDNMIESGNYCQGGGTCYSSLYNCTVAGNGAYGNSYGGGACYGNLYNSIVYGNDAEYGGETRNVWTLQNSCVGEDPRFADAANGDYHLVSDSPCIDAGSNNYVLDDMDLDGNERVQHFTVDIGCYEYELATPVHDADADFAAQMAGTCYGVFVGVGQYTYTSSLVGPTLDATNMQTRCVSKGYWHETDTVALLDATATKSAVRARLTALAAKAVSGDTVLYYQSSHGGSNMSGGEYTKDTFICLYDDVYEDYEMAEDLMQFAAGVKVVIVLDTCHSAGMFKAIGNSRSPCASFATRVHELMATRKAVKGEKSSITADDIGWIAAANYNQYSWDSPRGGVFTVAMLDGWKSGDADYDGDKRLNFLELWRYAKGIATGYSGENATDAQCLNENVLLSRFAGMPDSTGGGEATETTPVPVEHVWLDSYPEMLEAAGGDYEAMANAQSPGANGSGKVWPDGSAYYMWQDYVAGTNPTNENSVFTATIEIVNGEPVVTWKPDTPELRATRVYKTLGKKTLMDKDWNDVTDKDQSEYHFFKVTVDLP